MRPKEELRAIADEIVGLSDGSFHMAYTDEYGALTPEEQAAVDDIVYTEIGNCEACGWHGTYDNMEQHSNGAHYCWQCYQDVLAEEEDE
jgi:hypothetical protein